MPNIAKITVYLNKCEFSILLLSLWIFFIIILSFVCITLNWLKVSGVFKSLYFRIYWICRFVNICVIPLRLADEFQWIPMSFSNVIWEKHEKIWNTKKFENRTIPNPKITNSSLRMNTASLHVFSCELMSSILN